MLRGFLKHVAFRPHAGLQRHNDGLPQRIDRRIGYLGKLLAEEIVQWAHFGRQHRHGGIVTHGTHRLLAILRHGANHLITLFKRDLEQFLIGFNGRRIQLLDGAGFVGQRILDTNGVFLQPLLVGLTLLETLIHIPGVQYITGFGVHHQNLTGAHPAFGYNIFRLVGIHADFRSQGDVIVLGDHPAGRAQTISVQHTDGMTAIGHHQAGGAIPGFHMHGVVFVECTQVGVHGFHVLPGGRHHHAHSPIDVHATCQQQFQHVIQAG